jgi:hypothetical protein
LKAISTAALRRAFHSFTVLENPSNLYSSTASSKSRGKNFLTFFQTKRTPQPFLVENILASIPKVWSKTVLRIRIWNRTYVFWASWIRIH